MRLLSCALSGSAAKSWRSLNTPPCKQSCSRTASVVSESEPGPGDFIEPVPGDFIEPGPWYFVEPGPGDLVDSLFGLLSKITITRPDRGIRCNEHAAVSTTGENGGSGEDAVGYSVRLVVLEFVEVRVMDPGKWFADRTPSSSEVTATQPALISFQPSV